MRTKKCIILVLSLCASMAQLVEQLIRNQQVVGSSPTTSSKKRLESLDSGRFLFSLVKKSSKILQIW